MSNVSPDETVLRVSSATPVSLRLEAGAPLDVRLATDGNCSCHGASSRRPGQYTDTDFGAPH